jgi:hypothetical protein
LPKISKNIKNLGRDFDGHPYNEQIVGDKYHQQTAKVKKSKKKKSRSPPSANAVMPLRQLSPLKPRYAIPSTYLSGGYSPIQRP